MQAPAKRSRCQTTARISVPIGSEGPATLPGKRQRLVFALVCQIGSTCLAAAAIRPVLSGTCCTATQPQGRPRAGCRRGLGLEWRTIRRTKSRMSDLSQLDRYGPRATNGWRRLRLYQRRLGRDLQRALTASRGRAGHCTMKPADALGGRLGTVDAGRYGLLPDR